MQTPRYRTLPTYHTVYLIESTSGTHGKPKAAMITNSIIHGAPSVGEYLGYSFDENDCYMSYIPLSHV